MTYYELKGIRKKIDAQKLKVAAARDKSMNLSCTAGGMTGNSGHISDKTGIGVERVVLEEEKLNDLYIQLTEGIKAVPDEYIKTLIHCKLVKCWSWARIAAEVGGNNTGDGIRMTVIRYKW